MNAGRCVFTSRAAITPRLQGLRRRSLCLLIAATFAAPVCAQQALAPSNATITLQTLYPGLSNFVVNSGVSITTSAGDGVDGNNAQNWTLVNNGTISGANTGVNLSSSTANSAHLDNYGAISGAGTSPGGGSGGVVMGNGGVFSNHSGATVTASSDGVYMGTNGTVNNDGTISAGNGTAVYFLSGGSFSNSGVVDGPSPYGVLFNGGNFSGSNTGTIILGSGVTGLWFANSAVGTFTNGGTISSGTGVLIGSTGNVLTNTGTIVGTGGTAVSITGNNNSLILGTGSQLVGSAASTGTNNVLTLQGSGSESNNLTGFTTLNTTGSAWTLGGVDTTTGTTAAATHVQSGALSLTGTLTNTGAGGGTTIDAGGTLQLGGGGTTGSVTGNVVDNGTLAFNRSDATLSISGIISGTGKVLQAGSGTTTLSGSNTYSGGTYLNAGVLSVSSNGNLGNPSGGLAFNGGTLLTTAGVNYAGNIALNASGIINTGTGAGGTFSGVISGSGGLVVQGSGFLTLTGADTYTGGTTINSGSSLTIGNAVTSGSIQGDIVDNGSLSFSRSDAVTFAGKISGSGGVSIGSAGTLTLTGTNSYQGQTRIFQGATLITGAMNGTTSNYLFNQSSTLRTTASFAFGGEPVLFGSGTNTLDVLSGTTLTLANQFAYSSTANATANSVKAGLGTLVLSNPAATSTINNFSVNAGTLELAQPGQLFTATSYTTANGATTKIDANSLMSVTNAFTQAPGSTLNLALGSTQPIISAATASLGGTLNISGISTPGSASGLPATQFNVIHTTGGISNDFSAVTVGGSSTPVDYLTLSGSKTATDYNVGLGLTWLAGTTKGNGVFTLVNSTDAFNVDVPLTNQPASSVPWNGTTLTKNGAGTLTLSAANTYTGGTTINAGTLQLGGGGTTGSVTGSVVDNGTLAFNRSDAALTVAGTISGTGRVVQAGSGTTTLSGSNTYSGGTYLNAGVLSLSSGGANLGSPSGGVVFNGGTLSFAMGASYAGNVALNATGTFNMIGAFTNTWSGVFSGPGGLITQGAGALTLTGTDTYTGGTTLNSGLGLTIGNNATSGSIQGNVVDNGSLSFARSDAVTFAGNISGSGGVSIGSAGTLTLTGTNSYQGQTRIFQGATLITGAMNGTTSNYLLNQSSTLRTTASFTFGGEPVQFSSGTNTLDVLSGTTLTLANQFAYSSATYTTANSVKAGLGTLVLSNPAATSTINNFSVNAGTLELAQPGQLFTATSYTTANGATTKIDANSLMSVTNAFTQAAGSTLTVALGNTQPIIRAATANLGGTLTITGFNTSAPSSASGLTGTQFNVIHTTGGISNDFSSTTVGGASHPDYLTLSGGKSADGLNYNVGLGLTWLAGATKGNGVFTLTNGTDAFNVDVPLANQAASGTGWDGSTLTKNGAGVLTLSATNTYAGPTVINAGVLKVNGAVAGNVSVNAGATLGGIGSIGGTATVASGAHLAPGNSPGTLTVGNLVLNSGSILDYELGSPNTIGGGINDLTHVTGNLTLAGTLNVTDVGGFGSGVYRLINYDGSLLGNSGLSLGSVPLPASDLLVQTSVANQVNLIVQAGGFVNQFWDGAQTVGDGTIHGGTGTWNTTNTNWTGADGTVNAPWQSGFAIFEGSAGTVTLGENVGFGGMQFLTSGYSIEGNGFSLAGSPTTTIRTDPDVTATIDAPIIDGASGAAALVKSDDGTLILTASNTYTGGTTVNGGTLQLGNGNSGGSVIGDIANNGALVFNHGDTLVFNGVISGNGSVEQRGPGLLQLTAINTYTGNTLLTQGVLGITSPNNIGDPSSTLVFQGGTLRYLAPYTATMTRAVTVTDANGAFDSHGYDFSYGGTATGTGTLTKIGSGVLTLTGDSNLVGGLVINGGSVVIGDGAMAGSFTGNIADNASLLFNRSNDVTYAGVISGSGNLAKAGSGTLTFSNTNSYAGPTYIGQGTLSISSDANLGAAGGALQFNGGTLQTTAGLSSARDIVIYSGAAFIDTQGNADTFSGEIGGPGPGFTKLGSGRLILTGVNDSVRTIIADGVLQIGDGSGNGDIGGEVSGSGTLAFNRSGSMTFDGLLTGNIALEQIGSGTTILTGDNNYTDGTIISAGTLQIGNGETSGSIVGPITNDGALVFDRPDPVSVDSIVSGSGTLSQIGAGTLSLTGVQTYTGLTSVNAGRLNIDGSILNDVSVAADATLGGTGTAGGTVSLASGAHLAPGDSPGTLTVGNLVLNSGSMLDYELGAPNGINDRVDVTNNLSLAGTLNVSDLGGFSTGVYRLINYGGSLLSNSGLAIGAQPSGFVPSDFLVQTSVANQVNLIVQAGGFALQFWDGANTSSNGSIVGGSGTWDASTTNWTDANAIAHAPWQSGFAVFQGAAGTVTLGQNVSISGMQFATGGYSIIGNGFTLAADPSTTLRVDPGLMATINANIVDGAGGAAQLTKTDAGLLVLSGSNTYSGGTVIDGGTLQVSSDANLGASSGGLILDSGTLATTAGFSSARNVTLDSNGGTFAPVANTALTLSGTVSGAGALTKADAGTLVLGGSNSYAGGTSLQGGVLAISSDAGLGASHGALMFNGGTLRFDAGFDVAPTRAINLDTSGGSIDSNGFNAGLTQTVSGVGALTKLGAGMLMLAGDNTYGGGTTISAGVLQIGNGGTSGSIIGDIADNGSLAFNRSDSTTYAGVVSGSGTLSQLGAGTLVLGGNNTYTGGTTVSAGTLQLGSGGTLGGVVGDIVDNGALVFNRADDVAFAGGISGSGTLTKLGTNTLTLTGNNSYAGTTTIASGVLQIGDGGTTGSLVGNTVDNGGLQFNRSDNLAYAGAIGGSGWVRQAGPGTTVLSGNNSYTNGTFISAGTLSVSADNNLGAISSTLNLNGGTLLLTTGFDSTRNVLIDTGGGVINVTDRNKFSGSIDGTGVLTKTGSGALIINSVANYTGLTQVAEGSFVVGDSAHADAQLAGNGGVVVFAGASFGGYGSVVGDVANAGTLGVGNALATLANQPDASFSISGQLLNAGVVTMVNGSAADRLNVGTYISSGGQLQLETVLNAGGSATQTDSLVAHAVTLAGNPTAITVNNLGGSGAKTVGDGIELVSVSDPTASAAGAFVLDGRSVAGPYEYRLFQGGLADPTDGQWYLRSEALAPTETIYRPEVGAYLSNREQAAGLMMLTLHNRQGDPQYSSDGNTEADSSMGKLWFRAQGGITRAEAAGGLIDSKGGQSLFQLGGDAGNWNLTSANDRIHVGAMAGYGDADADSTAQFNPAQAHSRAYGYFAGAYATWFANNDQRLGSYVDSWVQSGWFDNQVRSDAMQTVYYHSTNWAASLEYGYGFAAWKQWVIEPQAQLIYNDYHADSLTDSTGTRVSSFGTSDVMGRLGVRVYPQLMADYPVRGFIEANWWHGGASNQIAFNGIPVSDAVPDNRYQINVGLQGRLGRGWVIWGRMGDEWGSRKYERVDGQLGVKYSW